MTLLVANAVVVVAATLQRSTGLGFSLIAVPALALLIPGAVPAALLILMLPLNVAMMASERPGCDRPTAARMITGRVAGTLIALTLLASASVAGMSLLIGGTVIGLVVLSIWGSAWFEGRSAQVAAGTISGIAGTVAASGGTPLALALQGRRGPALRATIAPVLIVGVLCSLTALYLSDRLDWDDLVVALQLAVGMVAGTVLGRIVATRLDRRNATRNVTLTIGLIGGVVVFAKGLLQL